MYCDRFIFKGLQETIMHEAPDVGRWFIHYTHTFPVSVIMQCLRYGVSAAGSTSVFRFHTHFICTLKQKVTGIEVRTFRTLRQYAKD